MDFTAEEVTDLTLRRHIRQALPGKTRKGFRALVSDKHLPVARQENPNPDDIITPPPILTTIRLGMHAKQQQREDDFRMRTHKARQ